MPAVTPVPNLFCRTAATTAELLAGRTDDEAATVAAAGTEIEDAEACGFRPDSASRFSRFRSPRKSAADW